MFKFFKRKPSPTRQPSPGIRDTLSGDMPITQLPPVSSSIMRDTLFGDVPMEQWPLESQHSLQQTRDFLRAQEVQPPAADPRGLEPWSTFVSARESIRQGHQADAIACWKRITMMSDLESRHYLQAWNFLRAHGVQPPAEKAKLLLGVVVEVPLNGGLDLLAAYPEHRARYYNFTGKGAIWDRPNKSLDRFIDDLLGAGEAILQVIEPRDQPRPPAPPSDQMRINLLTPVGLTFIQDSYQALAADAMLKLAVDTATVLMQQLVALMIRPKA